MPILIFNLQLYKIYKLIDSLTGTGDGYIRRMFDCAVLFYWDKFGEADFEKAVKVMFRWAYWLRIKQYSIYIESINNHAIGNKLIYGISTDFYRTLTGTAFLNGTIILT